MNTRIAELLRRGKQILHEEGFLSFTKHVLLYFVALMSETLIRLYRAWRIVCRAVYLRLIFMPCFTQTERTHDSIMRYLDRWVLKHAHGGYLKRAHGGYVPHDHSGHVPADCVPPPGGQRGQPRYHAWYQGIQQVRMEISELVRVLLLKGLDNNILEIGLGYHGGTHMLWRRIFKQVVTIEENSRWVVRFKLTEWLDSRSIIIVGRSQDPTTQKRVQAVLDSVDVLFIDGGHTYEDVAQDRAMYHDLVRHGGIIAFHDSVCKYPGVGIAKFLEDISRGRVDNRRHTYINLVYSDNTGISYEEC